MFKLSVIVGVLFVSIVTSQEAIEMVEAAAPLTDSPWKLQEVETNASLRGLHVFNPQTVWASGTGGTVVHTHDGGVSWRVSTIAGAEELDVRDIHAIDDEVVIAMTSGTPARIYRSADAGQNWKCVFESTDPKVFLDAVSFFNAEEGIVMGDPIDGRFFLLTTADGGLTWEPLVDAPEALPNEGGFAASGTNMITVGSNRLLIGLGGGEKAERSGHSRVLILDREESTEPTQTWSIAEVPIPRNESSGIFSLAFLDAKHGIAVGGNYLDPESTAGNVAVTSDSGTTWRVPDGQQPPSGYRSCVAHWKNGETIHCVTVGPNGTDLSTDQGHTWRRASSDGFHAIQFSPDGKAGWAVGSEGRVAKWVE